VSSSKSDPVKIETDRSWEANRSKNVTFVVTEDCQLRCRYCYMVGKNKAGRLKFDIARRAIDYLLQARDLVTEGSVVWDFIGGEPFLEVELIDRICDYFKLRAYELGHPWFDSYRFSFSTNGLLYNDERVQRYIAKNSSHLSVQITVDGTRTKHDLQRVYPDGRGSYDDVARNIPRWLEQFPKSSTKVTISSDDIPHIRESVLHLWGLGIKEVNINVVFEDVWKPGDDERFEDQLVTLADAAIDRKLYETRSCSFFSKTIGAPYIDNNNWCGAGRMLAVDHKGNFYPCVRFLGFSLQKRAALTIGNCFDGLDRNRLRPFLTLDMVTQSPEECVDCDVATGCAWCQGANYDFADTRTIFQRSVAICKMHKARVRANNYFWNKLGRRLGRDLRAEPSGWDGAGPC
jgi:uncharacterized protein